MSLVAGADRLARPVDDHHRVDGGTSSPADACATRLRARADVELLGMHGRRRGLHGRAAAAGLEHRRGRRHVRRLRERRAGLGGAARELDVAGGIELALRRREVDALAFRHHAVGQVGVLFRREPRGLDGARQLDAAIDRGAAEQVVRVDAHVDRIADQRVGRLRGDRDLHALGHELLDLEVVGRERLVGDREVDAPVAGIGERRERLIERHLAGRVRLELELARDLGARIDDLDVDRQRRVGRLVLGVAHDRDDVRGVARPVDAAIGVHRRAVRRGRDVRRAGGARLGDIGAQVRVAQVRQIVALARDDRERLRLIRIVVALDRERAALAARRRAARDDLAALAHEARVDAVAEVRRVHVEAPTPGRSATTAARARSSSWRPPTSSSAAAATSRSCRRRSGAARARPWSSPAAATRHRATSSSADRDRRAGGSPS